MLNRLRRQGIKTVKVFASATRTLDLRDERTQSTAASATGSDHVLAFDVVDPETGEVLAEAGEELTDTLMQEAAQGGTSHKVRGAACRRGRAESPLIKNTLAKDPTHSEAEALEQIYALLRPGDAPNLRDGAAGARAAVLQPEALRPRPRGPLQDQPAARAQDADRTTRSSPKDDFVAIIRYLSSCTKAAGYTDDIDHLGNRRIRSVGELIANQFSVGLSRMARLVKERMSDQHRSREDLARRPGERAHGERGHPGVLRHRRSCRSSWTRPTRWPS